MSADEKEGFMDETTGPEELSEKVKDQTAEVKENASAAVQPPIRLAGLWRRLGMRRRVN